MPRPTQKEISRRAGVTQATVSLALSNHPSIAPATRTRIQALAREIGYAPDPYLSGLAAYRRGLRAPAFQAAIAWVSNDPDDGWRRSATFHGYREGAAARAVELGYQLEDHNLRGPGMTPARLRRILQARNIIGLLLAPQPKPGVRLALPLEKLCAVTFGYTLAEPSLHLVALHQFRAMEIAFRRLRALGYCRPGLALAEESDLRADRNWSASFWSEQRALPSRDRVPMLLPRRLDAAALTRWYRRHRPDVILSIWEEVPQWLAEAGVRVPEEAGFAMLSVREGERSLGGIGENPRLIGARATERVIEMIHRAEYGVPDVPVSTLVDGTWQDGPTLRRR